MEEREKYERKKGKGAEKKERGRQKHKKWEGFRVEMTVRIL